MYKGTENTVGESATGSRVRGDAAGERTIGSRIRKLRIRTGMTQMQLSEELHIANKARLSNYELKLPTWEMPMNLENSIV